MPREQKSALHRTAADRLGTSGSEVIWPSTFSQLCHCSIKVSSHSLTRVRGRLGVLLSFRGCLISLQFPRAGYIFPSSPANDKPRIAASEILSYNMALRFSAAIRPLRPLATAKPSAQQVRWLATPVHPVTQTSSQGPTAMVFLNMGGPSTTDEVGDFLSRLFVSPLYPDAAGHT